MPWLDLHVPGPDGDHATLWYTTNTLTGSAGAFDPTRPTILLLHPHFLDVAWLRLQFDDARIGGAYNLIAFDTRACGRSYSRPSGAHDTWVHAADLAFAHHKLHLPPCHVFAAEAVPTYTALRFAALFPEMVLSLTLCQVPPPEHLSRLPTARTEMIKSWSYSADLNVLEHTIKEWVDLWIGKDADIQLLDDFSAHIMTNYPPTRRSRLIEIATVVMSRCPIEESVLASITAPTLILQSQRTRESNAHAETLAKALTHVPGGRAVLYPVRGAQGFPTVVSSSASIINQAFAKFIARLPHVRSDLVPHPVPLRERMAMALRTLSVLMDRPELAARDPRSPVSFSCVPPAVAADRLATICKYAEDQQNAFSPVNPATGRPLRKFSERSNDQWRGVEINGLSVTVARPPPEIVSRPRTAVAPPERLETSRRASEDGGPRRIRSATDARSPTLEVASRGVIRRGSLAPTPPLGAGVAIMVTQETKNMIVSSEARGLVAAAAVVATLRI